MNFHQIKVNKGFVGRKREWDRLSEINSSSKSEIVVVYGRRRVGKTELIEQFFKNHRVWKFEGIQPDSKIKKNKTKEKEYQLSHCLEWLGKYLEREHEYSHVALRSWSQFFDLLLPHIKGSQIVLYFEEVQWLANYQDEFMAELKVFWDNHFRHIRKFRLVFSGSSPSFIVGQFLSGSAMYNRSEHLIHLMPFDFSETKLYLKRVKAREVMLATLCTGGVCEYLRQVKGKGSVFQNICRRSFVKDAFFLHEYHKIFVSNLSNNKHYINIIEFLSRVKFATRQEIARRVLKQESAGGELTKILIDLESCGFVEHYTPIQAPNNSMLSRYNLSDEYLQFFFKFIKPNINKIQKGVFEENPLRPLSKQQFSIVMGLNFERWCRKNEHLLAQKMNFGTVEYEVGPFFNRYTENESPGFQIDLMYIRKDHRIVLCEIKYYDGLVGSQIKAAVNEKLEKIRYLNPKYKNYTLETALITTEGAVSALHDYFDYIITLEDF